MLSRLRLLLVNKILALTFWLVRTRNAGRFSFEEENITSAVVSSSLVAGNVEMIGSCDPQFISSRL